MSSKLLSNNMKSSDPIPGADAEHLSALFDGHLGDDAARFAFKRLGQDAQWREACGRWQLAGDVLRGNSIAPAASGFADRVMSAIAHEPDQGAFAGASAARRRVRHQPRWIGGALAASVAIAALFVARPMWDADDTVVDTTVGRETGSAPSAGASAASSADSDFVAEPVASDTGGPAVASVTIAAAAAAAVTAVPRDAPRRSQRRRSPASASARTVAVASRTLRQPDTQVARAENPGSQQVKPALHSVARPAPRPFMPTEIAAKPWPRAAVPGYSADAAMTAGFHSGEHGGVPISFYPFEPAGLRSDSLHGAVERGPAPAPRTLPEPPAGAAARH